MSGCAFSPEGSLLASVSWAGLLKLWDASMCAKQLTVKAHENRITGPLRCPLVLVFFLRHVRAAFVHSNRAT